MLKSAIQEMLILFLDARMAAAQKKLLENARFESALALVTPGKEDAQAWFSYCCQTLARLTREGLIKAVYDFADTVHNTPRLYGLEDGRLMIPRDFWEAEIQPFRAAYGERYFEDFSSHVVDKAALNRAKKLH